MKYILSRFFVVTDSCPNIIQNLKTGERLEVSEEVLKLLFLFKKPKSIQKILSEISCSQGDKKEIRVFLKQLIKEKVLVSYPESEKKINLSTVTDIIMIQSIAKKTFFNAPAIELRNLKDENIAFIGTPFDLGTTKYPGARFAPDKIRALSADAFEYHADIFTKKCNGWFSVEKNKFILKGIKMVDIGDVLLQIGEGFEKFYNRVFRVISILLDKNIFPVIIGGDHSSTYACIKAFKQKYENLNVIQIDAHTDLGDILPKIPNNHGNVFTKIREENLINHLYQFGVRDLIGEQLVDPKYSLFSLEQMRTKDVSGILNEIDLTQKYYLSLDIDVLDPAFAPGVGTPVTNGMLPEMLYKFLSLICNKVKIVGFDIVEVNPMTDRNDQTSELALGILFHILMEVFNKF